MIKYECLVSFDSPCVALSNDIKEFYYSLRFGQNIAKKANSKMEVAVMAITRSNLNDLNLLSFNSTYPGLSNDTKHSYFDFISWKSFCQKI